MLSFFGSDELQLSESVLFAFVISFNKRKPALEKGE